MRDPKAYVVGARFDAALRQNRGYLEILDVNDPTHPVSLGRHDNARAGYGYRRVDMDGGVAWLAEVLADGRVEAVDVTNPAIPRSLGTLPDNAFFDVAAAGTRAFLVGTTGELTIAEASSTPSPPRLEVARSSAAWSLSPSFCLTLCERQGNVAAKEVLKPREGLCD